MGRGTKKKENPQKIPPPPPPPGFEIPGYTTDIKCSNVVIFIVIINSVVWDSD